MLLGAAVLGLLVLSYRSVGEWRRTSRNLAENRAELMLTLLSTAISRDMKGAHTSVLLPLELADVLEEPPFDLRETFARALARFPYAESFFVWRNNGGSAPSTSSTARTGFPRGIRCAGASRHIRRSSG